LNLLDSFFRRNDGKMKKKGLFTGTSKFIMSLTQQDNENEKKKN